MTMGKNYILMLIASVRDVAPVVETFIDPTSAAENKLIKVVPNSWRITMEQLSDTLRQSKC